MLKKSIKFLVLVMAVIFLVSCGDKDNKHAVVFKDEDGTILKTEVVSHGKKATPPEVPNKEGKDFIKRDVSFEKIEKDTVVTAIYELKSYTVRFLKDGILLETQMVKHGENAVAPQNLEKEGHTFTGFFGMNFVNFDFLKHSYGVWIVTGVCLLFMGAILLLAKIRKWF